MLKDLLSNQKFPISSEYMSGIADRGRSLASKFSSGAISGIMGGVKQLKDSMNRISGVSSGVRKKGNKKDPHHTTLGPSLVLPLRRGDSESDILAKMYNFMNKVREDEKKREELRKDFELEQKEEDERRHKKLIDTVLKYRTVGKPETEDKKGFFGQMFSILGNILSGVKTILSKVMMLSGLGVLFKNLANLPTLITNIVTSVLPSLLFRFLPKMIMGILSKIPGPVGVAAKSALVGVAGYEFISHMRNDRLKEDREFNKPKLQEGPDRHGLYTLKAPGNHTEVKIPLTENERTTLVQTYEKIDAETDESKISNYNDIVDQIFEDALKRKQENPFGPSMTESEKAEKSYINVTRMGRGLLTETENAVRGVLGLDDNQPTETPFDVWAGINPELRNFLENNTTATQVSNPPPISDFSVPINPNDFYSSSSGSSSVRNTVNNFGDADVINEPYDGAIERNLNDMFSSVSLSNFYNMTVR